MKLFGRNKPPVPEVSQEEPYRLEAQRVLGAVTNHDDLGTYITYPATDSIFSRLADEPRFGTISIDLARIESRVMYND